MYDGNALRSMEIYNTRLPKTAIKELNAIAQMRYMPTRTLIIQRPTAEQSNIEPAPGAEVGATTPGTDGHQTQRAGADGY